MNAPSTPQKKESSEYLSIDSEHLERILEESRSIKGVSLWQDAWKRLRRNRTAMTSLAFLCILSLAAIFTPLLPLQSPLDKDLKNRRFLPPSMEAIQMGQRPGLKFAKGSLVAELAVFNDEISKLQRKANSVTGQKRAEIFSTLDERIAVEHPFEQLWNEPGWFTWQLCQARVFLFGDYAIPSIAGTDELGRDLFSRLFWGARVSLMAGLVATLVSLLIGVAYGAVAGYCGGSVDAVMMRIVDMLYSIPFIFVVLFVMAILQDNSVQATMHQYGLNQLTVFYMIIGAIYWLTMSRVVRGQVLSLRSEQFVEAAKTIGASQFRIVFRHLVPNVFGVVIVYLTLTIPAVMLFEAFLSFLGLGVSPPDVSWGMLMQDGVNALSSVKTFWWMVLFPGAALAGTLFALNFLGDGLRDALDPRMKNRA